MFVGVLVLLEMLLLQDFVSPIPQSVFAGILFKVGYDVFDWAPVATFWRQLKKATVPDAGNSMPPLVSDSSQEMFFIMGTTPVTVVANLNIAVVGFTVLFYVGSRFRGFTDLDHLEGAPQLAD